jgi:integrase
MDVKYVWSAMNPMVLANHHPAITAVFPRGTRRFLLEADLQVWFPGGERVIPLNSQLAEVLRSYAQARGAALPTAPFFRSRFGRLLSRGSVYER